MIYLDMFFVNASHFEYGFYHNSGMYTCASNRHLSVGISNLWNALLVAIAVVSVIQLEII